MKNNKKVTILAEKKEEILIRIDTDLVIGEKVYKTVRHEWWHNRKKMEQQIYGEDNFIYCRGFSGSSDDDVLSLFKKGCNNVLFDYNH